MRILFANHTGSWSGAEVSLLRVVEGLRNTHEVTVACPGDGPLREAVEQSGVRWLPLPTVDVSLRPHPRHTPVGLAQLRNAGAALAEAAQTCQAQVVHANTPRTGLMGAVARRFGAPPIVVRAHEHLPLTPIGRSARSVIVRAARSVAAVSDYTAERFNQGLPRPVATRVYNSIDHSRFRADQVRPAGLRATLGLREDALLLGQIAQITPWKGQDTSIRALAELRRAGLDAHLMLVGTIVFGGKAVRHDNHAFRHRLDELVNELQVRDAVHFLGQRDDVPEILADLDLSMLPSWEEPFGLATVESLAMGTTPLVSAVGAGPELVQDGVTGRVLDPHRPAAWATAARELLEDLPALRRVAERGPSAAARFTDAIHAREMLELYATAASAPVKRSSRRHGRLAPRRAGTVSRLAD
jgi:glycosyltransferase involved in cell wall biosynthesis